MIRKNHYDPIVTTLVCAFAWAVPGGGHFWLGQWRKGAVFFTVLPTMFCVGLWLEGRVGTFDLTEPFVAMAAFADLGIGVLYFFVQLLGLGSGRVVAVTHEYGNTFLVVSGLLNMLVVLDTFDTMLGRKP